MFQRYSRGWSAEVFEETFGTKPVLFDSYNVAPMQNAPVVRRTGDGKETLKARWGIIPRWVKEPFNFSGSRDLFNADAEALTVKPTFRRLHEEGRRCLVPALGFYQWREDEQPHFVRRSDGGLLVFAGLYDHWRNDKSEIYSFAVVTKSSSRLSGVCDRIPVILGPEDFDLWLKGTPDEVRTLLRPPEVGLEIYRVDGRVGRPRENDATLIERLRP